MRVRYAKRGRLRFTSHRDFSRAFERALVRARIPMAYSSGFNPHPRISYAGASPTGAASEAEYLEIGLAERVEADRLAADLDEALPERLEVSRWRIDLPGQGTADVEPAVASFLAATSVVVERMTKKGMRSFDSREAVLALTATPYDDGTALEVVLRHTVPSVRPDD